MNREDFSRAGRMPCHFCVFPYASQEKEGPGVADAPLNEVEFREGVCFHLGGWGGGGKGTNVTPVRKNMADDKRETNTRSFYAAS